MGKTVVALLFLLNLPVFAQEAFVPDDLEVAYEAYPGAKVLIGDEGREEVDTNVYPYTAVGKISFRGEDGFYGCTGVLVAKNVVLTNGHCVWDKKEKKFYSNHTFSPGFHILPNSKYGTVRVKKAYVSVAYQNGKVGVDFGFLVLEENIGEKTGWFGVSDWQTSWLWSDRFYVTGYGSNYTNGIEGLDYQTKNKSPCHVARFRAWGRAMVHNCDTGPGSSGSPFYTYVDGKPTIAGVHFGGSGSDDPREGCGAWMTDWIPQSCENWATRSGRFLETMIDIIEEAR